MERRRKQCTLDGRRGAPPGCPHPAIAQLSVSGGIQAPVGANPVSSTALLRFGAAALLQQRDLGPEGLLEGCGPASRRVLASQCCVGRRLPLLPPKRQAHRASPCATVIAGLLQQLASFKRRHLRPIPPPQQHHPAARHKCAHPPQQQAAAAGSSQQQQPWRSQASPTPRLPLRWPSRRWTTESTCSTRELLIACACSEPLKVAWPRDCVCNAMLLLAAAPEFVEVAHSRRGPL